MPQPEALYHWSCSHSAFLIRNTHRVIPNLGRSWWTDIDGRGKHNRDALGLTSKFIACDRMAYKCKVHPDDMYLLIPWAKHVEDLDLSPAFVATLTGPKTRPERWWVATQPVRVISIHKMRPPR
jgi:hypothetical protein